MHLEIRLRNAGELTNNLLGHYDALSREIQTDLPLKRIWVRVLDSEDAAS